MRQDSQFGRLYQERVIQLRGGHDSTDRRWEIWSLQQQIGYTISKEAVSTDFVGDRHACVFDSQATIVNGEHCVLYCWYDNEFGYSCQVVRCLEEMAGVRWAMYPRAAG